MPAGASGLDEASVRRRRATSGATPCASSRWTERDAGTRIDGSRTDLFVLRLEEHNGGGYLWDIDQLKASGFGIVRDELEAIDGEGIGGPVIRRVTAEPTGQYRGRIALDERRPWEPDEPIASLKVDVDLTGPEEEGLSRAERRSLLEAA
jgi:hypothetical protein